MRPTADISNEIYSTSFNSTNVIGSGERMEERDLLKILSAIEAYKISVLMK